MLSDVRAPDLLFDPGCNASPIGVRLRSFVGVSLRGCPSTNWLLLVCSGIEFIFFRDFRYWSIKALFEELKCDLCFKTVSFIW